jgi:pimeloyl-ACP methyl ester carboxylesterase
MKAMSKVPDYQQMIAEWGAASDRGVVARAYYDDMTLDLRPGLPAIKTPIVLLHPDNVPLGAPAGMMQQVYVALFGPAPTVTVKLATDSQHFVMLDQPEAFAKELDAFLAAK